MQMFVAGEMFELAGKRDYEVMFADDKRMVCCPVQPANSQEVAVVLTNQPEIFSNDGSLHEKYWVKKIDPYARVYLEYREL